MAKVDVVVEGTPKRTFVAATDWPGWARGARREEEALEAFLGYAARYARVVRKAAPMEPPTTTSELEIIERLGGDSGTEFGIPSRSAKADLRRIDDGELGRQIAILEACRRTFDEAARKAVGVTLTTGPRGGGRVLEKIIRHVVEADQAYLQQLGSKPPKWTTDSPEDYGATIRKLQVAALTARANGEQPPNPNAVKKLWSPRYFVRRAAWHLLDHAWEIEDRSSS
jgi:hypothetical protein